jgi:HPt (histidine-containing phosphotransfer) domain-containing protein
MASPLLDPNLIAEIRLVERTTGRTNVLSGLVSMLEMHLVDFQAAFAACVARGDVSAAARAAHTMQGSCRQLGAGALGDLFAAIESSVRAGDYAEAQRRFDSGAELIARSLEALKRA